MYECGCHELQVKNNRETAFFLQTQFHDSVISPWINGRSNNCDEDVEETNKSFGREDEDMVAEEGFAASVWRRATVRRVCVWHLRCSLPDASLRHTGLRLSRSQSRCHVCETRCSEYRFLQRVSV